MAGPTSSIRTRATSAEAAVLLVVFLLLQTTDRAQVSAASIPDHVQLRAKHHHLISKLSHYELVRPYRSTPDGDFLTHDLSTAQEENRNVYERAKRDTARRAAAGDGHRARRASGRPSERAAGPREDDDDHALRLNHHFRVDAFGARLRLDVTRNRFLVTPRMRVERYDEDGTRHVYRPDTLCFYTGRVTGVPDSSVAVSNCNGLSGFIKTGQEEYVIEPLESQVGRSAVNVSQGHLHIMYRPKDFNAESNELQTALLPKDLHDDSPDENGPARGWQREEAPDAGADSRGSGGGGRRGRSRRRAGDPGQKHFVETLLAADYSMTSFHGMDEMTTYLLTILNIVNMAYRHDTMTSDIQFAASRIILLNEAMSRNHVVERQAQASLSNVCRWAASQTVRDDTQANHHDLAAFVTRLDFGPAGYAPVTGMCAMTRSCALSRDEGLLSSFVLAHEAGHVFGMEHDGVGNDCTQEPYRGSIMAPVVISTYTNFFWSVCSIKELERYLPNYDCLEDDPFESGLPELEGYPGEWYTMDEQCKFDFGEDFELCGGPEEPKACSQLWCIDPWDPQYCRTKKGPPLDGSYCGTDMWCLQGVCSYKDQQRQNGEWSKFSPWSECSYPCGVGVQVRKRRCDNPPPTNGGKDCKGESYEYRLCNKKPCVGEYEDRRAKQCVDSLASYVHRGSTQEWLPHENRNKTLQCRLTCITKRTDEAVVTEYNVTDGTPCSYDDHHSICIQGKCVKLGCDKRIDSTKVEDLCGVCDGDNSECLPIKGNFYQAPKKKYQVIHTLPAGSRNIDIRENSNTDNFLALRHTPIKEYILNSQGTQSGPHSFIGGGARFVYSPDEDRLISVGPLHEDLELLVFWKKNSKPMNVSYSYYLSTLQEAPVTDPEPAPVTLETLVAVETVAVVPPVVPTTVAPQPEPEEPEEPEQPEYLWQDEGWTDCTKTCGGGFSFHRFQCYRTSDNAPVKKTFCGMGKYNPKKGKKPCNTQPCAPVTTAPPPTTTKATTTTAKAPTTTAKAPTTTAKASTPRPPVKTTRTTARAPTTTPGRDTTTATTPRTTTVATPRPTTTAARPTTRAPARTTTITTTTIKKTKKGKKKPVFKWEMDEWEACSHSCGAEGQQSRGVRCIKKLGKKRSSTAQERCSGDKPATRQECNRQPCPAFWSTSDWSSCTVTCGDGYKHRDVICGAPSTDEESQCMDERPDDTAPCNEGDCPEVTGCVPLASTICQRSSYKLFCMMPQYETMCCTTCEEQEKLSGKKKKRKGRGRNGRNQ